MNDYRLLILRRALALAGVYLLLASVTAASAEPPAAYGCDRPIRLAYYEFGALYHDGQGTDRDVVDELARRTGCVMEAGLLPRSQIWHDLEAGDLDLATSGIVTAQRRTFSYTIPYLALTNVVIARRDIAAQIHSFDDVIAHPEWRVGVVGGYVHGPFYDFRLPQLDKRVVKYPDEDRIYQALQNNDVQIIISATANYNFYFSDKEQRQGFTIIDLSPAAPIVHYMFYNRNRFKTAEINSWGRVFDQMTVDGTLAKIYKKWLPDDIALNLLRY